MMEMDEKDRNKFILICVVVLAVAYVGGNWATTQLIADALEYHELLPGRLFGHVFYGDPMRRSMTQYRGRSAATSMWRGSSTV